MRRDLMSFAARMRIVLLATTMALGVSLYPADASANLTARSGWELAYAHGLWRTGPEWSSFLAGGRDGWGALSLGWHKDPWSYRQAWFGLGFRLAAEWVSGTWRAEKRSTLKQPYIELRDPSLLQDELGAMVAVAVVPRFKLFGWTDSGFGGFGSSGFEGLSLQLPVSLRAGVGKPRFNVEKQEVEFLAEGAWLGLGFDILLGYNFQVVRGFNLEVFSGARFTVLPPFANPSVGCESVTADMGPMWVIGTSVFFGTTLDQENVDENILE
jgi:hypothetical protein